MEHYIWNAKYVLHNNASREESSTFIVGQIDANTANPTPKRVRNEIGFKLNEYQQSKFLLIFQWIWWDIMAPFRYNDRRAIYSAIGKSQYKQTWLLYLQIGNYYIGKTTSIYWNA